mgnify:CR=1 FL=1
MFSREEKAKAVALFIHYDLGAIDTIRELGYYDLPLYDRNVIAFEYPKQDEVYNNRQYYGQSKTCPEVHSSL